MAISEFGAARTAERWREPHRAKRRPLRQAGTSPLELLAEEANVEVNIVTYPNRAIEDLGEISGYFWKGWSIDQMPVSDAVELSAVGRTSSRIYERLELLDDSAIEHDLSNSDLDDPVGLSEPGRLNIEYTKNCRTYPAGEQHRWPSLRGLFPTLPVPFPSEHGCSVEPVEGLLTALPSKSTRTTDLVS